MFKIIRFIKNNRLQAVLAPLFKMLEATFELFVPIVVAKMIDNGIKAGNMKYTFLMGGILVLLAVVGLSFSITAQYFSAVAAIGVGKSLRSALFRHIESLSYKEIDEAGASTLITRMTSDVNQVQTKLDRVTLLTRESLVGVRVVRAFNRQEKEKQEFSEAADGLRHEQITVGRLSALMNPVTLVIVNLGIAAIIYKGGLKVEVGDLTQGEIVALVNLMSQILVELVKLANLIITMTKAVACANRVTDILNVKSSLEFKEVYSGSTAADVTDAPRVEFRDVSLNYNGSGDNSLDDISFTAKAGDTIGVIGGTGSGKSSLINLIPRFYDATCGAVLIDGKDVKDYGKEELRQKIGVVPQKAVLFKGTVAENIRWGKSDATDEEVRAALETAQALSFIEEKEGGINFALNQGAKNLSGGQKQRVTIARALVRRPCILILDDSSSALDYATDAALRTAIRKFTDGMTVFIVSQRASSIMHADKIIVLDDGRIAGIGTHDELLESCAIYQEICHSQMGIEIEEVAS